MKTFNFKSNLDIDSNNSYIDNNGFMYVKKSPILKSGILEYYGEELGDEIDGEKIQADKLYKVYIPIEEIEKAKDTFKLKPIQEEHEWLGLDGENAKGLQEGTTGENVYIEDGYLMIDLQFNNLDTIRKIKNDDKKELSASYENKLTKAPPGADYDFIATDILANHVALVEKGRCGSDVRVYNNDLSIKIKNNMSDVKLILDDKEVDLSQFMEEEQQEGEHNESITDKVEVENEDKRKLIDEIGGILKGKVDEELWRTIIGKAEKLAYESSETSQSDNEEPDDKVECQNMSEAEKDDVIEEDEKEEKKDGVKSMNYDYVYSKMYNSIKKSLEKEQANKVKAYNMAKKLCGEFDYQGMNELQILNQGLASMDLKADNVAEANAMIKVCNKSMTRVDNSFSYNSTSTNDEIEVNF